MWQVPLYLLLYCSPQCQTIHWKQEHKKTCNPHNILIYYAGKGKLEEVKQYMLDHRHELRDDDDVHTCALRRACRVGKLPVLQYMLNTLPRGYMWTRGERTPSGKLSLSVAGGTMGNPCCSGGECSCMMRMHWRLE